jgi:hypothetical protein
MTPWLHLRKISELMETYPQVIPKILKVVEPLKAYKWRHFHGVKDEKIIKALLF